MALWMDVLLSGIRGKEQLYMGWNILKVWKVIHVFDNVDGPFDSDDPVQAAAVRI